MGNYDLLDIGFISPFVFSSKSMWVLDSLFILTPFTFASKSTWDSTSFYFIIRLTRNYEFSIHVGIGGLLPRAIHSSIVSCTDSFNWITVISVDRHPKAALERGSTHTTLLLISAMISFIALACHNVFSNGNQALRLVRGKYYP